MYEIGLRDGARSNAGRVSVHGGVSGLKTGQLVALGNDGKIATYANTKAPFAVVSGVIGDEITVMQITGDMYMIAPVSGTDAQIAALADGEYIGVTAEGVDAGVTDSTFCRIVSTNGAKTAGDKILVRFEY